MPDSIQKWGDEDKKRLIQSDPSRRGLGRSQSQLDTNSYCAEDRAACEARRSKVLWRLPWDEFASYRDPGVRTEKYSVRQDELMYGRTSM